MPLTIIHDNRSLAKHGFYCLFVTAFFNCFYGAVFITVPTMQAMFLLYIIRFSFCNVALWTVFPAFPTANTEVSNYISLFGKRPCGFPFLSTVAKDRTPTSLSFSRQSFASIYVSSRLNIFIICSGCNQTPFFSKHCRRIDIDFMD